jgi:hypothetical protein
MSETVFRDKWNNEIALADTVRETILARHPEVADFIDRLSDVVAAPDQLLSSVHSENSVLTSNIGLMSRTGSGSLSS